MPNISTAGLTMVMNSALLRQQNTMALLSQQLSSNKQFNTLTEYKPTEAHNILDFKSGITQREGYISAIKTVQQRLSMYDTTMTDIEKFAAQAVSLAAQNQTFDIAKVDNIDLQATNFLKQLTNDLNQQISGRYIYSGTRYNKAPVIDLTTVTGAPTATQTANPALPTYDTDYANATQFEIDSTPPGGNLKIGNITVPWAQIVATGSITSVDVNGVPTTLTTPIALTAAATPTAAAANAATVINALAADSALSSQNISQLTASSTGPDVTVSFNGSAPQEIQPTTGAAGTITWLGGPKPDGTLSRTFTSPSFTLAGLPTGDFTISNVTIDWAAIAAGSVTTVDVGGTPTAVTVTGLSTNGTTADLTANLAKVLNQIASQVPVGSGLATMTALATGTGVSVNWGAGTARQITPDSGGGTGEILWDLGSTPDGNVAQLPSSSIPAWTEDTVLIDDGFSVKYGVTSNDPSFQKMVSGIRYINAAVTAGKAGNVATYQANMLQASTLLTEALTGIQSLHSQVINNQNTLENEIDIHTKDITSLKNQLTDIQQVDLTEVGTKINLLQTQMQASYSATASVQQLSLVKYL